MPKYKRAQRYKIGETIRYQNYSQEKRKTIEEIDLCNFNLEGDLDLEEFTDRGNLKDNIKETFEVTIEHLLKLKPPIKKNKRQALVSSLQALMKNDESVCEEYESLNAWIVDKEHQAMFKKARVVQYNISYGAEAQEINPLNGQKVKEEKEDELLSRIPHKFFILGIQTRFLCGINFRAYILCLLNFITKHISLFMILHSDQTLFYGEYKLKPLDVLQSFKIETRNYHAHSITKSEGKWNNEKLQRFSTLALELVDCLCDEDAFESLLVLKWNLSSELTEQYVLPMKRRHENNENEIQG
ncbi:166_t:CDS:2 [Gigaspora margarita]|uniref:166_t:CDS:1 n=1 Tax=Gigaspora margarita TaxID=4874 RepID=A0ABN7WFE3_GIGMA|nr:166_t:CDS:2 [Gigaspora margarita]